MNDRRIVAATVAWLVAWVAPDAHRSAAADTSSSLPVVEHSNSIILRASHILVLDIGEVEPGPWSSERDPATRQVKLEVRVREVLKGRVDRSATLSVTQHRMPLRWRDRPVYRPWSEVKLVPGAELVAFARSKSTKLEQVLDEKALLLLHPPAWPPGTRVTPVLPAVRLARRAEAEGWDLVTMIRQARSNANRLDGHFLAYLWHKLVPPVRADANGVEVRPFAENPLADKKVFLALMDLAATPGLDRAFRLGLVGEIGSSLFADDDHDWHIHNQLRLLFRLLPMLDQEDARYTMEQDIIGYLRLDRPDWGPARMPREVFGDDAAGMHAARRALGKIEHPAATRLRTWLDSAASTRTADELVRCLDASDKDWKGSCPGKARACADSQSQAAARLTLVSCHREEGGHWIETPDKLALRYGAMIMFVASGADEGGVDCWFASKKEWETIEPSVASRLKDWAKCTRVRTDEWF